MRRASSASFVVLLGLGLLAACDETSSTTPPTTPPTTFDAGDPGDPGARDGGGGDGAGPVLTACPDTSKGTGTDHATEIAADETWTAAASPHRVKFGIRTLAKLTIEPCATVLVDADYVITVGSSDKAGALVAKGERGVDANGQPVRRGVTFAAADPQKPWGGLTVWPTSKLDLETVTLTDGASAPSEQSGGGVILARGETFAGGEVVTNVRAVDVVIGKARGYGFNLLGLAGFTSDSRDITVKDGGRAERAFPMRLEPGALSTVPTGLTFTGNAADAIEIVAGNTAMGSDTVKAACPTRCPAACGSRRRPTARPRR